MKRINQTVLAVMLALLFVLSAVGCTAPHSINKENTPMERSAVIQALTQQLDCSERTANSILQAFSDAGIESITSMQVIENSAYILLEIRTVSNCYYATMGLDCFVESIREGSQTGTVIYREMQ